ncbi:Pepco domain-containing protein [Methanobacterium sp.]|uniref:Pepco domain-containing protein n=1 Tax=Methanobacterium sp. TaxID=2164 RepID=UPI003C70DD03
MAEQEKPLTIQFLIPDFEVGVINEPLSGESEEYEGAMEDMNRYLIGQPQKLDFDKVQKEFNNRLFEVLSLLSESKPVSNDFQIDKVTFSVGVNLDGKVSILGSSGISVGSETGIQVTLARK